ncbi:phosphopyruvate hydratase [Candidatus Planktophila lacus]|uniref:Enolase n=1 Tax=Candidatus Planktophila lacus TaxID=1884913 RepID=A0AAC9YRK7_9ACTN|nr:phosphopyruvate hydratase [Candidatus Planktophila lacus]ASY10974.1 enolase [Candidatus Planktophila lacus]ASY25413.1 enolase [Candidatus Planktophila lacus]
MNIKKLLGYQVLDSRGRPTVAVTITLSDGSLHTARVPSGASTGAHEARELRDAGTTKAESFYAGKSVYSAVENINSKIAPKLLGHSLNLAAIDGLLVEVDPTPGHQVIGANATLATSLAVAKAAAHASGKSLVRYFQPEGALLLPMPMVNILSGGAHANRSLDIQDVLVVPHAASNFAEALSWIVAIRERAASDGKAHGVTHLVADEGGLGLSFPTTDDACEFVLSQIEELGLSGKVSLALDIASTQFFADHKYSLTTSGQVYSPDQFVEEILDLVTTYPISSIEDPFAEDDWASWSAFAASAPAHLQILGDDLFTTNLHRLERGIAEKSANAILIKANQNGLLTSTHRVLDHAHANNFATVVSARSGETEDSWLADIATSWRAQQIKVGSTHGSERTAKWNRLLELEATEETEFARPFKAL